MSKILANRITDDSLQTTAILALKQIIQTSALLLLVKHLGSTDFGDFTASLWLLPLSLAEKQDKATSTPP